MADRVARPAVIGIVNCTPDSFYSVSRTPAVESAIAHALKLVDEGADMLDFGGQSTRPGSESVSVEEEIGRVIPVIEAVSRKVRVPISIDTDKPQVAAAAREAGANTLNDTFGLRADGMLSEAVQFDKVIIMHMQGTPRTMQKDPQYSDVVSEVSRFLTDRKEAFISHGGNGAAVMIDPGIGFGKTLDHNLSLLKHLRDLSKVAPVVLGASRKSFMSKITPDNGPEDRLAGSIATAVLGALDGVSALRVHDVAATRRAVDLVHAVRGARP